MLMYDGRVFVEDDDTAEGTWSAGPNLPVIDGKQFTAADASSALPPRREGALQTQSPRCGR